MKKMMRGLLLFVASLGMFAMASGTATADAATKTALPQSYRGTWYVYFGEGSVKKAKTYVVLKLKLTNKKLGYKIYTTPKKNLTSLKWQGTGALATAYSKKINQKKKVVYRVHARIDSETLMVLGKSKVKVKVLNKKVTALRLRLEDTNIYAFRKPLRTHALTNIVD